MVWWFAFWVVFWVGFDLIWLLVFGDYGLWMFDCLLVWCCIWVVCDLILVFDLVWWF